MFEDVVGKVIVDGEIPHWSYIYKAEKSPGEPDWVTTNVITTSTDHRTATVGYYYKKLKKDVRAPNEIEMAEIIRTIFTKFEIR